VKKKAWKREAKEANARLDEADHVIDQLRARLAELDRGIAECWQALRDDGCTDCGRLPEVMRAWLKKRGEKTHAVP
jgi:hypothetical protein